MEKSETIVKHPGVVTAVSAKGVTVRINSVSACASCAAHAKCGFAESKDKTLEIPTEHSNNYQVGQHVTINIDHSRGLLAVWFAYLLPAILLIAVIAVLSIAHIPEGLVALAALATLGLYILVLYIARRRIDSHFTLTLSANSETNS